MRAIALHSLFMLFSGIVNSQITFNHRFTFGFPAAVLTSILSTDSCYYASGVFADSVAPYNVGNIFLKIDLEGNPVFQRALRSTSKTYETWYKTLISLPNGGFAVSGYSYDSIVSAYLIKYNILGDSVLTKEYLNPFYPSQDFTQTRGLAQTLDGGFLLANYVRTSNSPNADIQLIKTDSLGNIEWDTLYYHPLWDRTEVVIADNEGNFYVGALRANTNMILEGYSAQCHILKVSPTGNILWDYLTPISTGLWDSANDMVLLEDGSLVIATGEGTEMDWPSVNQIWYDKCVFKLSPSGEIVWKKVFSEPEITGSAFMTNVEIVSNGSGFVLAGTSASDLPLDNTWSVRGWVGKVNTNGDSLWAREYIGMESGNPRHQIFDLKEAADGGFILCGESKDNDADSIPQQAWLLKLDQHGCLIPGCHLPNPTAEPGKPEISLAIYPNPTTDYLNFQLRSPQPIKNATFRIVSASAQVIKSFAARNTDATFILPVWDWASGIYYLQYLINEELVLTEKFIKN